MVQNLDGNDTRDAKRSCEEPRHRDMSRAIVRIVVRSLLSLGKLMVDNFIHIVDVITWKDGVACVRSTVRKQRFSGEGLVIVPYPWPFGPGLSFSLQFGGKAPSTHNQQDDVHTQANRHPCHSLL
jgi:hypothetical protein